MMKLWMCQISRRNALMKTERCAWELHLSRKVYSWELLTLLQRVHQQLLLISLNPKTSRDVFFNNALYDQFYMQLLAVIIVIIKT